MARVIKGDAGGARVVPSVLADAASRAQEWIATARAEADAIRNAAREDGRMQGRAELASALLEHERAHAQSLAALEQQTLDVALLAAKRIVGDALALEPQRIAEIALPLLARLRRAGRLVLRVHADDRDALDAVLLTWRERKGTHASLAIEVDASISRGGCVVSSDIGTLDARVETQLAALASALRAKAT